MADALTLRPYQEDGVAFLTDRPRAYLADVMGIGKTVQACVAAARLRPASVLVIGPAIARQVWRDHAAAWMPGVPVTILSYEQVTRLPKDRVPELRTELVIIDEAHYAKNLKAKRTRRALWLAQQAKRAWLLSGTPMPNHPGELFAPVASLWPERTWAVAKVRTYRQWLDAFCVWTRNDWGGIRVFKAQNADRLRALLFADPACMLRRKESDVDLQLPPLDTYVIPIEAPLTAELHAANATAAAEFSESGDDTAETPAHATLRRLAGEAKAPVIANLIANELDDHTYPKIVLFAHHHSVLDTLQRHLSSAFGAVRIDGRTSDAERTRAQRAFARPDGPRVLLGQTKACGVALTITAANQVGIVEPSWTPDDDFQAIKRIHRIGQERHCTARLFALHGTVDVDIMSARRRKLQMIEEVVQ